ncbi:hypothetical protein [Dokdonella sp.]|uniref:hypothetical protein n=1 Tax=Dokdonella sp. TaxID=2291710 RepID=UPI0037850ECA
MKKRLSLGLAFAALAVALVGCDRLRDFFLFPNEHRVVLSEQPLLLDTKPTRLTSDQRIEVAGNTTDLCATISRDAKVDPGADGDVIDGQFAEQKGGAHLSAVLHARDGKDYEWKGDSWSLSSGVRAGPYRMDACLRWESLEAPPKGTEIASIDLLSDRPLRVMAVHWRSTDAFDFISQPPPDPLAMPSTQYSELAKLYGSQAAWTSPATLATQVTLESRHRNISPRVYHSTLLLRMSDAGIQLEPASRTRGMGVVTIPTSAVEACSMTCFGKRAKDTLLLLPQLGLKIGILNAPEVIDWCWNQHVPMAANADASAWFYKDAPLPAKDTYDAQFASRAVYDHQASRSCMGY